MSSSPTEEKAELEAGTLVDHFKIIRLLGRGGMGVVYLARDIRLGRLVAIKVIHSEALSSESRSRIVNEARLTASFSHPNIVTVFQAGEHGGLPYVALEYVEGQPLNERLVQERPGLRESLRIGTAIAEAIEEAHRHSVLHRDLKPANVMLAKDGRPRVLDFGLAKQIRDERLIRRSAGSPASDEPDLDPEGAVFETTNRSIYGTPAYMAPEQWQKEPGSQATDVWALGVILYEMLAGLHPFIGPSIPDIYMKLTSPEPLVSIATVQPDLPSDLNSLVDRCLSKDPIRRPNIGEVRRTLERLLDKPGRSDEEQESPFRGLLPFSERHAALFFGRDAETGVFLERIREEPIIAVVGPSGGGKSSFIQAGVIPRLREQGRWTVLRMRPGSNPFEVLAALIMADEKATGSFVVTPGGVRLATGSAKAGPEGSDAMASTCHAGPVDRTVPLDTKRGPKERRKKQPDGEWETDQRAEIEGKIAEELRQKPGRLALHLIDRAEMENKRVMLFVDQLEEICTLVSNEETRRCFMQALFSDGKLEIVSTQRRTQVQKFLFDKTPVSEVTRIIQGPFLTVLAGYADGTFGLWSMENGKRMAFGQLHGSVVHLMQKNRKLHVATDLGQHHVWDLGIFYKDRCQVLRKVWSAIPIIWQDGLAVLRPPPSDHPCRASRRSKRSQLP